MIFGRQQSMTLSVVVLMNILGQESKESEVSSDPKMVTLFCAVVGEKESAFSIEIDANDSVGDLMDAIALKEKYEFAASKLKLFVAKTSQNKWLSSFSDEVKNLKEGLTTVSIK